jgi:pimeloyl-ACP methyl ester carboxylesterase
MRRLVLALILAAPVSAPLLAASVDGLDIHYAAWTNVNGSGTSPTLVFVHGWTCDSSSWRGQAGPLSKEYRVIALDLPGHGKSESPPDGKFSMNLFARAVEAVRAEVGAERVVLVGHSMGAPVIREYARLYPDHVAALVAVDGPLDMRVFPQAPSGTGLPAVTGPDGLKVRETVIRSMFIPETSVEVQNRILEMMLAAPEATAAGAMAAVFDPAIRWTEVIEAPVLAVYAGTAQVPDPATTKELFPNYDVMQMAGTGHFLMMEKPDEFNRVVAEFLAKLAL